MQDDLKQLTNNIGEIFKTLHQKSYHKKDNEFLYPGQPKLIALIKAHEGITQKELAEKNHVKPSTITGMLIKLEVNQFVYRVPDEADKRIMRVYLTQKGHEFARICEDHLKSLTEQLFYGFTEEEIHTFIELTNKMKQNLKDN